MCARVQLLSVCSDYTSRSSTLPPPRGVGEWRPSASALLPGTLLSVEAVAQLAVLSAAVKTIGAWARTNFLQCYRDQLLLLPPSLREWLPVGHLVWYVIDTVERLDLTAFYRAYRLDGQGRAAHELSQAGSGRPA